MAHTAREGGAPDAWAAAASVEPPFGAGASRRPRRPHVPPLLLVALCFWASACGALALLAARGSFAVPAAAASGAACIVAGTCALRGKHAGASLAILGASLGILVASGFAWDLGQLEGVLEEGAPSGAKRFLIVEDASLGGFGKSCFAQVVTGSGRTVRVRLNLPDDADVRCWDTIEATAELKPAKDGNRSFLWRHGACGQATVRTYEQLGTPGPLGALGRLRNAAVSLYQGSDSDGAALMQALLFGERERLFQRQVYEDMKRDGIAHMVAVSGAHLAVVSGFAALAMRALRFPRRFIIAATTAFICAYIIVTGAPVSAMRAGAMAFCSLSSFFAKRRAAPSSALGAVILCLIGASPSCALSLSFALSALSTLGIILFGAYFQAWASAMFGGRCRGAASALGLTFASNVYTLPLSVSTFGQLSLVAPLANAVLGPLFSALCVGGMLCTAVAGAVEPLGGIALSASCGAGEAFCELVRVMAQAPYAAIAADGNGAVLLCGAVAASGLLLWAWPVPRAMGGWAAAGACGALLACAIFLFPAVHGNEIVMLDVGQGDAFVLRSGAAAVLIDTGTDDAKVLQGLARHDIRHLDAVLITHPDDDHCGSLRAVMGYVTVDRVCVARDLLDCECDNCAKLRGQIGDAETAPLDVGDVLAFGSFRARVLSPAGFTDEGGNADSVVMRVECDADADGTPDASALFCGDAESDALDGLMREGLLESVDILKVPHHGSKAGLDDELMERLRPKLALISVGAGNRYGHPRQETLERLQRFGCATVRTDEDGDVVCSLDGSGAHVRTAR